MCADEKTIEAFGGLLDEMVVGRLDRDGRRRLQSMAEDDPQALVDASPGALFGAAEVLSEMGGRGMDAATRALSSDHRSVVAVHLIALVGCMGVQGAEDGLHTACKSGDEATMAAASLWLDHRFAIGPTGAFWELQGTRVDDWRRCPRCGKKKLNNKRGAAAQCVKCGVIYADPDFQPTFSTEPRTWGLMTGHTPWRPMMEYEMRFWGMAKPWLTPPRGFPMPFPIVDFQMLGADMDDSED